MSKKYYAIKRGYDKETNKKVYDLISEDWSEVKPLVIGYDDARYKGFNSKEEAKTWLEVVDVNDAGKRSKRKIDSIKNEIGISEKISSDLIEDIKYLKSKGVSKETIIGAVILDTIEVINKLYK